MKHSFKESYDVLQRHAAALRNQSEPNIDDLLRIVEESVAAYKICQTRIDAVEKALDKALSQVEPSAEHAAHEVAHATNHPAKPASSTPPKTPATPQSPASVASPAKCRRGRV